MEEIATLPAPIKSPAPPDPTPAPQSSFDSRSLLSQLNFQIPTVQSPAGYGVAMAGLIAFLALISVSYVALIAFLAWLLTWHVMQTAVSFQHGPYFLFHGPMALIAGLLLLFLIKPLFFRRKADDSSIIALDSDDQPLLFSFLEKLCAAAGAPAPAAVEIDCEANAAARFQRRGVTGGLGKQFVLRIGLPLASAMTVRQFAGVIAHELGHFRQRGGMAGSYFIRLAMAFFARIVFERDRLDFALMRLRSANSGFGRLLYWLAAGFIEGARGVLWLMLVIGELLSCGVLRRMEYDADLLEAHVAGCGEFAATSRLMLFLSLGHRRAQADLANAWNQRRLADDLPALIVDHANQLSERRQEILKLLDAEKTRWFDTHPSHSDRVKNVDALGAGGLLPCDLAAKNLFSNFPALCRRATRATHTAILGDAIKEAKFIPTRELLDQRTGERRSFAALRRYFQGAMAGSRPIMPNIEALNGVTLDNATVQQELIAARDAMLKAAPAASSAADQYEDSSGISAAAGIRVGLAALFSFSSQAQGIRRQAEREKKHYENLRRGAIDALLPFESAARTRLTRAIRLALADASADTAVQARTELLLRLCHDTGTRSQDIIHLRELALQIRILTSAYDDTQPYEPLVDRILRANAEAIQIINDLRMYFEVRAYPFAHAVEGIRISQVLVPRQPNAQDPVDVHDAAIVAIDGFYDLIYRALAELAERAETIEKTLGFEPLPEPPEREDKEAEEQQLQEQRRDARKYYIGYGARAAGGIAMVAALIFLSINPPTLPALGWPKARNGSHLAYRPASFRATPTRAFQSDYYTQRPDPRITIIRNPRPGHPEPHGSQPTAQPNRPQPHNPNADRNPNPTRRNYQPQQPQRPNTTPQRPSPGAPRPAAPGRR